MASVGSETLVNTTTASDQKNAAVTVLSDGGWLITWQSSQGLFQQRYTIEGSTIGGETLVARVPWASADVTSLPDGGWIVAFEDTSNIDFETREPLYYWNIYQQRYTSNGDAVVGLLEIKINKIDDMIGSPVLDASLVTLSDGGWIVTWRSYDSYGYGIYQQRYTSGGVAVGNITHVNTTISGDQLAPAVTALSDGGWVVTWQSSDGSGYGIYQQRYTSEGAASGIETKVGAATTGPWQNPAVTTLPDGGWVVTWQSPDSHGQGIYQQRYTSGGVAVGDITHVSTTVLEHQAKPAVTALSDGGWVVTWQSSDGSGYGIYQQRYTSEGAAIGIETRVNTTTTNPQVNTATTALPDGGWIVTWEGYGPNGVYGIYQQRFDGRHSPTAIHISGEWSSSVEELAAPGTQALRVKAEDFDDERFIYTLSDNASGRFAIDNDGNITVVNGLLIDYEQASSHTIRVRAADSAGQYIESDFKINVKNIDPETASGGENSDILMGGLFEDNLSGGGGSDRLFGGSGDDILDGGVGADTLTGDLGNDTYVIDDAGDKAVEVAGQGTDLVQSSVSFSMSGSDLENLALMGAAAINGTGNSLINQITGNSAANVLDGSGGADSLTGGLGNDTYVIDNAGDKAVEANGEGIDLVCSTVSFNMGGSELENLILTGTAAISGTGNSLANQITGNSAANVLNGLGGADILKGGLGNDFYAVDNAGDRVFELTGQGTDLVQSLVTFNMGGQEIEKLVLVGTAAINGTGNSLSNEITGNSSSNVLNGLSGADVLRGGLGNDTYVVDNAGDQVFEINGEGVDLVQSSVSFNMSGQEIENLILTGVDAIGGIGNSIANQISGNSAANVLDGLGGADTLVGGLGNDTYVIDNARDKAIEGTGQGIDLVQSSVSFNMGGQDLENLVLTGSVAINGTGNSLANQLIGNTAANVLNGLGGADTMIGGLGNDFYAVDNVGDRVIEFSGQGRDLVQSLVSFNLSGQELENLVLVGTASINGTGNSIANEITGNSGANVVNGMAGQDTLTGGTGKDTFVFSTALGAGNVDRITDFSAADDTIQLSKVVFTALSAGTLAAGAFKDLSVSGAKVDADDRILYDKTTGALSYDADGSGSKAAVQFAIVDTKVALTAADFFVV